MCSPRFNNAVLGEENVLGICVEEVVGKCICLFWCWCGWCIWSSVHSWSVLKSVWTTQKWAGLTVLGSVSGLRALYLFLQKLLWFWCSCQEEDGFLNHFRQKWSGWKSFAAGTMRAWGWYLDGVAGAMPLCSSFVHKHTFCRGFLGPGRKPADVFLHQ